MKDIRREALGFLEEVGVAQAELDEAIADGDLSGDAANEAQMLIQNLRSAVQRAALGEPLSKEDVTILIDGMVAVARLIPDDLPDDWDEAIFTAGLYVAMGFPEGEERQ